MQHLHERLKHLTKAMNFKQTDLAKQLGVEKSLVTKHFNKQRAITIEHLELYAKAFMTTPEKILEGTPEWEHPDYQEITRFLQRNEQPSIRTTTDPKKSSYQAGQTEKSPSKNHESKKNFMDKLSWFFAGTAVAGTSALVVNAMANKAEKKKKKQMLGDKAKDHETI